MNGNPLAGRPDVSRWQRRALAAGVAALAARAVGAVFSPRQFFAAYLAAYLFWQGLGVGALGLLLLYHLTGGAWGYVIRRILEAQMRTLPLLAVLFLPIALGVGYLYDWARTAEVAASSKLQYQQFYLNKGFFWGRAAVYFAIWLAMAWLLARWSRRGDQTGHPRYPWLAYQLAGPGAVALVVIYFFAGIDWLMSLQTIFPSTIFSALFGVGQVLTAHLAALVVLARLADRPPLAGVISLKTLNDLGNLAFAFMNIWAYMAFFQFMLVWIANLPPDVIWYLPRSRGGWIVIEWLVFLLHFAVPFVLLLTRSVKRRPRTLAAVAGLVLFMHLVFLDWEVLPIFPAASPAGYWMAFLLPIGIGGLWLATFLHYLASLPLLADNDLNRRIAEDLRRDDEEEAEREAGAELEEAPAHG